MTELLKGRYFTASSISNLGDVIEKKFSGFDKNKFTKLVFDESFDSLELKAKMRHTTICLKETLPQTYKDSVDILIKVAPQISGFESLSLPDFVELYGIDEWEISAF